VRMRVNVATDVAMIGIWDAGRPSLAASLASKGLEHEAAEGRLFLIHTGGDCGGEIDVLLDEPPAHDALKNLRAVPGEFLLLAPSGRLTVGGAEDYRKEGPRTLGDDSTITVPSGDYRLCCYASKKKEEEAPGRSIREVEVQTLGPEDLIYYRRLNRSQMKASLLGYLTFLLFPALVYPFGWKIALAVTLALALPYYYLLERWAKRNIEGDARWQRLNKMVGRAWQGIQSPLFVLHLERVTDRGTLQGGSVQVD
jgi:hypothetical protein